MHLYDINQLACDIAWLSCRSHNIISGDNLSSHHSWQTHDRNPPYIIQVCGRWKGWKKKILDLSYLDYTNFVLWQYMQNLISPHSVKLAICTLLLWPKSPQFMKIHSNFEALGQEYYCQIVEVAPGYLPITFTPWYCNGIRVVPILKANHNGVSLSTRLLNIIWKNAFLYSKKLSGMVNFINDSWR